MFSAISYDSGDLTLGVTGVCLIFGVSCEVFGVRVNLWDFGEFVMVFRGEFLVSGDFNLSIRGEVGL